MEVAEKDAIKMKWNKDELVIFILLHEIKHAIEWTYDRKQITKDHINSKRNKIPHNERPHEKRANKFARQELDKWI